MRREYKVNITKTVLCHMWVVADDPQEAIDIAEEICSGEEVVDIEFDVDVTEHRKRR